MGLVDSCPLVQVTSYDPDKVNPELQNTVKVVPDSTVPVYGATVPSSIVGISQVAENVQN